MNLVLSSTISDSLSANMTTMENVSNNVDQLCGAKFCPVENAGGVANLHKPDLFKIQILSGIFIVLMICATVLVSLFADTLKRLVFLQYIATNVSINQGHVILFADTKWEGRVPAPVCRDYGY